MFMIMLYGCQCNYYDINVGSRFILCVVHGIAIIGTISKLQLPEGNYSSHDYRKVIIIQVMIIRRQLLFNNYQKVIIQLLEGNYNYQLYKHQS